MKDTHGQILYIGKAKNLKSRVSSYFNQSVKSSKTHYLLTHVVDFDFILTSNEASALVLENRLIKQYNPKYNIRLRDDKTYPYLQIDGREPFPRLALTRRPIRGEKQVFVFGPFAGQVNLREVIRILTKALRLRDCSLSEFKRRKTPCLLYQMGHCMAPCVQLVTDEEYQRSLQLVIQFFKGEPDAFLHGIHFQLEEASEKEEFERAGLLRDSLTLLQQFLQGEKGQQVERVHAYHESIDLFAFYEGPDEIDMVVYLIRQGVLLGHKHFVLAQSLGGEERSPLLSYGLQYYSQNLEDLPQKIIFPLEDSDRMLLQKGVELLTTITLQVVFTEPEIKELEKAAHQQAFEQQRLRVKNVATTEALRTLQRLLGIPHFPEKIECYDVAVWQGSSPTASQVVWEKGRLQKKDYRYYSLNPRIEGHNDVAFLREAVGRRLKRGSLPDLIVLDGGKGQLNGVVDLLQENELYCLVVALAKRRNEEQEERLFLPGRKNPIPLKKYPHLMHLLCLLRDEAHRFSRELHHLHEKNRLLTSWIDQVKGVGEKRKKAILSALEGDWEELLTVNPEQLAKKWRIPKNVILQLQKKWKNLSEES